MQGQDPEHLIAQWPIPAKERVAVACSGGMDSTLLAHLLAQRSGLQTRPLVVHVQHGLRGRESLEDEEAVRRTAQTLELPIIVLPASVPRQGGTLEHRARQARYGALCHIAREEHLSQVFMGHHRDDDLEWIVMALERRSGPRGLGGIPASRSLTETCTVSRPFLPIGRSDLLLVAKRLRIAWQEDRSNADLTILRNRVRHRTLPALLEAIPDADARLCRLSRNARELCVALLQVASDRRRASWIEGGNRVRGFTIQALADLPRPVLLEVFREDSLGGSPLVEHPLGWQGAALLLAVIDGELKAAHLPGGTYASRVDKVLFLESPGGGTLEPLSLPHAGSIGWDPAGGSLQITPHLTRTSIAQALDRVRRDPRSALLRLDDASSAPLTLRGRVPGDRLQPLGASGRSTLGELQNVRRVPRPLRSYVPVLCAHGAPIWTPWIPLSDPWSITPKTRAALEVRWNSAWPSSWLSGRGTRGETDGP